METSDIISKYDGPEFMFAPVSDIYNASRDFFRKEEIDTGKFSISVTFDMKKYLEGCGYLNETGEIEFPVSPYFQTITFFNRLCKKKIYKLDEVFEKIKLADAPFGRIELRKIANTCCTQEEIEQHALFNEYARSCSEYLMNPDIMQLVEIPRAVHESSHKAFFEQTGYGDFIMDVLYSNEIIPIAESAKKTIRPITRKEDIPDVIGLVSENIEFQSGKEARKTYERFARANGLNEMLARAVDEKYRDGRDVLRNEIVFLCALKDAEVGAVEMGTLREILKEKGYAYFIDSSLDSLIERVF